jgi:carboxyl-terminal processing protease
VINVLPDGPSFKVGIKTGDKLIKVNDSVVAGKKITSENIKKLLRGDLGSTVTVTIQREGQLKAFTISRDVIPMSSVDANYMLTDSVGYIRLNKFFAGHLP